MNHLLLGVVLDVLGVFVGVTTTVGRWAQDRIAPDR